MVFFINSVCEICRAKKGADNENVYSDILRNGFNSINSQISLANLVSEKNCL